MHILSVVKEHATGCGKTTLVITLPKVNPIRRDLTFGNDSEFFWSLNKFLQPILNNHPIHSQLALCG